MLTTQFELSTMNLDCFDHLTIESILDLSAEVAGRDANQYQAGFKAFKEAGCYWVIAKVRFEVLGQPNPEGGIIITTWPKKADHNLIAYRDFIIKDAETDNIIVKGQSVWCAIDIMTRKMCRLPAIYKRLPIVEEDTITKPWERLKAPTHPTVYTHTVEFSDLDHNGHMNNARYGRAIWNALNLEDEVLKDFSIQYEHECRAGDTLILEIEKTEESNGHHYRIVGKKEEQVAMLAEVITE